MAGINWFDNPTFSDLKIKFNGQEIYAHKAVVCTHSSYFSAALTNDFSEARSGVLDLGDDNEAEHVRAMIRHMYRLPYDVSSENVNRDLLFHAGVFDIGDKYDVPSLRSEVVVEFPGLMQDASHTGAELAVVIKAVYAKHDGRADESLEQVVLEFCARHMVRLHGDDSFASMLKEVALLSGALLDRVWSGLTKESVLLQCKYCCCLMDQRQSHLCSDGKDKDRLDSTSRRARVLFLD